MGVLTGVCGARGFLASEGFSERFLKRFFLGVLGENSVSVDSDNFLVLTFRVGELWGELEFEPNRELAVKLSESTAGWFGVGYN